MPFANQDCPATRRASCGSRPLRSNSVSPFTPFGANAVHEGLSVFYRCAYMIKLDFDNSKTVDARQLVNQT